MNRNRLISLLLSGLVAAGLLVGSSTAAGAVAFEPMTQQQHLVTTSGKSSSLAVGGFWVTVTHYPSKYGSLSSISRSVYGKAGLWKRIFQANRKSVGNPNLIRVGQRLYVPVLGSSRAMPLKTSTPRVSKKSTSTVKWARPLSRLPITSCYGMRWGSMHQGIDYDGVTGQKIFAVGSGKVKKAGWWAGGYGISVLVHHGGNTYTHYAHMSKLAVGVGRTVKAGQVIGYVGATGHVTGSHLHFEVWRGMWNQVSPGPWLRSHGIKTGC